MACGPAAGRWQRGVHLHRHHRKAPRRMPACARPTPTPNAWCRNARARSPTLPTCLPTGSGEQDAEFRFTRRRPFHGKTCAATPRTSKAQAALGHAHPGRHPRTTGRTLSATSGTSRSAASSTRNHAADGASSIFRSAAPHALTARAACGLPRHGQQPTELRRAELAIHERERQSRKSSTVRRWPFVIDAQHRATHWNRACATPPA